MKLPRKSISKAPGSARSPIVCATQCAAAGRSTPVTHYARTGGVGSGAGVLPNELTTLSDDQARHLADLTRLGMAGNLADFVLIDKDGAVKRGSEIDYNGAPGGYAADPTEVVNYVSKHDNQTLWDMISYKAAQEADLDTRVRMQAVSLATVMLGRGDRL